MVETGIHVPGFRGRMGVRRTSLNWDQFLLADYFFGVLPPCNNFVVI